MLDGYRILEALDAAVYVTDAEGRITFYNKAAARLWGHEPALGSLWCGSWRIFNPDGTPLPHDQCPMAQALKEARPIRGAEALLERPDGARVAFLPFPTPLFDDGGNLCGAVNLLVDLSKSQEERARLAAIVASSDDAIVSKTLEGRITFWNTGAQRIFGYTPEEMVGEHITKIIPPELHGEEKDILARLARGERIEHYETVRVAKDGRRIDISLTVSPVRNASGCVIGASKVARDITERKRAEDVQRLLLNELNHRVKNTLATVDAIARQTLRRSPSPQDFVAGFAGRLKSLSRAHGMLTNSTFRGAQISQLIRDQLTLGDTSDSRISWAGPDVMLDAQLALHLALVLHELGTNARKHGALSNASGTVAIGWVVESDDEQRRLVLNWRENGGPKVDVRRSSGFGMTLIEQSLKPHGGEVKMAFAEHGVSCMIALPLAEQPDIVTAAGGTRRRDVPLETVEKTETSKFAGKRVLLVEDETLIAMVMADYLTEIQCDVVGPAGTVEAALSIVASGERIDAALLDANLAGKRIDEVALTLTQRAVPFAFVTGYGREALPQSFADAITVEKPFSQRQILEALEHLLMPGADVVRLRKHP